jgi:hypothetical protein
VRGAHGELERVEGLGNMVPSRRPFKSLPLRVSVRPYASADFSVDEDRAVARAADGDGYGTPSIDDMTRLRHRGARVISEGTGALAVAAKKNGGPASTRRRWRQVLQAFDVQGRVAGLSASFASTDAWSDALVPPRM